MSNEDIESRLADYNEIINRLDTQATSRAITALDDDPESGARALQLSRATGAAPLTVYGDLNGFEKEHRSALTANIVRNNNALAEYIRGNALADVISNDDYGNLDKFSRSVPDITWLNSGRFKKIATDPIYAGVKGAYKGAKDALFEPYREEDLDDLTKASAPKRYAFHYLDISRRVISAFGGAMFGGAGEFAAEEAKALGADPEKARRETQGILESEMGRAGEHQVHPAKPWLDAGIEPPRGIHPEIDRAKVDINSAVLDQLKENLADAQSSTTRERAPELFRKFAEQHYGDAAIAISGDRVAELYSGGRVPSVDDGILGWIPNLEAQLEAARATGDDIHVPLADWITYVDPAIARDLHDDLRSWAGGITINESKNEWVPNQVVDSPLAQVRDSSGTEPLFAIGDKKLELKKNVPYFDGMDEFQFHDQDGKVVGELTVIPDPETKQLYVANINGLAGLYSNSFGPSLIRSLKKQLKEAYPDYETITGHRVSGARYSEEMLQNHARKLAEKDGKDFDSLSSVDQAKYMDYYDATFNSTDHPVVKLALDDGGEFNNLLSGVYSKYFGEGIYGGVIPTAEMSRHEIEVSSAIREEIAKIAPKLEVHPVSDIFHTDISGDIKGAYIHGESPRVLVGLFSEDPIGYGRHEAIHYLKNQGMFTGAEWNALVEASKNENWLDRYNISDRYSFLDEARQHEEAIAEAYRDWAGVRDELPQPQTLVTKAFERIKQFLDNLKSRIKEIFGRDLSFEELFSRIERGEVGARKSSGEGRSAFAVDDDERINNLRAEVAGLDAKSFKNLHKLIQARFQEDIQASLKRAEQDQKRTQTKEWKEQAKELRKEVESSIRNRPDVLADLLVGAGEIAGVKLKQRIPLLASDLTLEQKKGLPRHYYSDTGVSIDEVAKVVGYTSGNEMIARLVEYNSTKENLSAKEHLAKVIDAETERQMQVKYGDLQQNIIRDAIDQALSENTLNILAEEWQGAAMKAGVSVIDKDLAKSEAMRIFADLKVSDIDSGRLMTQMLRHYRDAARELINNNPAQAVVSLQRRYMAGLMAAEAKKLEKQVAAFDKTAKQMAKREVASVEPEYLNWIHSILMQVGKPVRRSIQDLQQQIEGSGVNTLEDFVASKVADLREVPVWDQLFDPKWNKTVDQLTTEEFRAVHNSIKTLVHNGRDERKIYKQGEAADYAEVKQELIQSIANSVGQEIKPPKKPTLLKTYFVSHLQLESIFNRWDAYDSKGKWNQYLMRDLIDGANQVDAWKKEYANRISALKIPENLHRALDNPIFKDQDTDTLIPFTRKNLLAVMMNTGTGYGHKSNLFKLAKGYGLDVEEVMSWVNQHATKAEWDYVRGVWDVFADIKSKADTMYRSLSGGVAPENIPVYPVQTTFGEIKGGYYPIIFHSEMEGTSKKLMGRDPLEQDGFVRATTPAGYTKSRTGYVAPLALDLDQMPNRISQMLHDIGLRPAVLNAAKVFYDHDVRSAVRKYYGDEYKNLMIPYLQAIANSSNQITKTQTALLRTSEFIRQNVISTLVGLNPGTVLKHGPSALVTSMREVGPNAFLKAVQSLFRVNEKTGQSNWEFAIKHSLELQRRDRNWEESLYGAARGLKPGEQFEPFRQKIIQIASKPVALSDMLSAVPTWLAKYEAEIQAGGSHGDAIYEADRAVRRAHGSTAITNRTTIMRDSNPWLTSVYNFFSDIMNRQMETIWKAGDALDLAKSDKKAAMAMVPGLTASLFAYAVWPAIVEHAVSGKSDEKDSWNKTVVKAGVRTAASSWVGVRDFANWMLEGYDPQLGLAGTAMKELGSAVNDLKKDDPFGKEHRGRLIQDGAGMVGTMFGIMPQQIGRSARFIHDVNYRLEHPRNPWAWMVGLRYGTTKGHATTTVNYMKGIPQ